MSITTEAVIEQEPRGKRSAMETSDQASLDIVKPEIVEQLQRLTATQGTEIQQLRKLAADLDQRLTSGFYQTPYVGQGRPPTPGVAAGPEMQQPEVRLYDRYGDGAHHNRSGFYSPPGYTLCVQPNGVQYTPFPETQRFSRPDNAPYAYPDGVSYRSQEADMRQVDKVLSVQQLSNGFSRQPEMDEKLGFPVAKPVVQFYDATPGNMVSRPSPESRQDTTVKTPAEMPETGSTELETVGTVYHTAKRDNSSYKVEPTTHPEPTRTRERKILQYDSDNSEDDSVSERRHQKEKAETDAKAGATRHSSRHSNGTSKRAIDPADAKVGSTQYSPPEKSNSCSTSTADRTSRHKKRQSTSTPRSASTEGRRRDRKKSANKEDEPYSPSDPSDASMDSSSEEEKVVSPKHIMKPPKFDGQCSFETFVVQFSNCAEYNKWNEAQKLAHLRNSLEKDAANLLWDYGKDTTGSWKGLTEILENRFGGKAMA